MAQMKRSSAGRAKKPEPKKEQVYKCCRCGREFTKQLGNFSKTRSPMWAQGNEGYLPVCNHCTQELYEHYAEALGSKEQALKRLCMKFDVFWSPNVYKMTLNGAVRENPFKEYVSKSNLAQVRGTSFDDTLDNEAMESGELILDTETVKEISDAGEIEITPKDIERWGAGYTKDEYRMMDAHYRMLTAGEENIEFLRDKYIRDMCNIQIQANRAMAAKDNKGYADLLMLYQKVANAAQIKITNTEIDTTDDAWGKWLAEIEVYTPADYYADKKKYRDFFGIQEYCERFLFRPLKNLLTGSKDKDKEFNLDGDTSGSQPKGTE